MNSDIISFIQFDVSFALNKLQNQVDDQKLKDLLIRSDRKLFDSAKLAEYLSEVSIMNTFLLRDIVTKAIKVVEIYNNDFVKLEQIENEDPNSFGTPTPFECIEIQGSNISDSTDSQYSKKIFIEKGGFEIFKSQHFANKSALILNLITAAYPELRELPPPKKDNTSNSTNKGFKLKVEIDSESCYHLLLTNFIDTSTTKKSFKSLFDEKEKSEKVEWVGTLAELARFTFLLHNDHESTGNKASCIKSQGIYKTASNLFSYKGKTIDSEKLKNNNREIKDRERLTLLLKAVKHLQAPVSNTRK